MNATRIEWTDLSWNPVSGCLGPRGDGVRCTYCYAHRLAKGRLKSLYLSHRVPFAGDIRDPFAPRFWLPRLDQPFELKRPSRIFVGSMCDLFGDWVPRETQDLIMDVVRACPQHTFLFLTKWPQNLAQFNPWPPNAWVGATATDQPSWDHALDHLARVEAIVRYLSLEPLLDTVCPRPSDRLDWLIVGGLTGPDARVPWPTQVEIVLDWARYRNVPLFFKDNLRSPEPIQEWPHA